MAYLLSKRAIDLAIASVVTIAMAPFMALIVLAIRRDSPGPAVFRQQRIGQWGQPFMVYKFRTMTIDSPSFGLKPQSAEDERLTRVGRLLRQTSLDELPQLLNVVRGEMSLVGPRPEQPFLVSMYEDWQRVRLEVLPGITGWWQVNGRKQPMHDHVEEDLYYVHNRSFLLDVRILVQTVGAVFRGTGAV